MGDQDICSPISSQSVEVNPRRSSLSEANSLTRVEKELPRYLQPSSGSCHDFCKYGKHYEFEKKPRRPFPGRQKKKPVDDQYSVEMLVAGKKTPEIKLKPQPNVQTNVVDNPEIVKCEVSANSVDGQTSDRIKSKKNSGTILSAESESQSPVAKGIPRKKMPVRSVVTKSADSRTSVSSGKLSGKKSSPITKKAISVQLRTSPDSSRRVGNQHMPMSSEMVEASIKQAPLRPKPNNLSTKHAISSKLNLSSPGSSLLTSGRKISDTKEGQRTRTPSVTVKKALASPRGLFSPRSSGSRGLRLLSSKTLRNGIARGVSSPKASLSSKVSLSRVTGGSSTPKVSSPSKVFLSRAASLKQKKQGGSEVISVMKNRKNIREVDTENCKVKQEGPSKSISDLKEPNNDVVQEKTLYVIKMETENKYVDSDVNEKVSVESSPPPSSLSPRLPSCSKSPSLCGHSEQDDEESEYCSTDVEEEPLVDDEESNYVEDADGLEDGCKARIRNGVVVAQVDKDGQPVKLRFRRGKVVDILSESRSPRRLKFRRGRVLGENHNVKRNARLHLKGGGSDGKPDNHQIDSEKVVLRHQDMQGKKDTQGLFNNVIEETASKLVETRKSKVKALVGAFETVISLQDRKTSVSTVS